MNGDPTRKRVTLYFQPWPEGFRLFAKHVAYAYINSGTPASLVEQEGGNYVPWPSPGSVKKAMNDLLSVVSWLAGEWSARHPDTPVHTPTDLDSHHLDDARKWIEALQGGPESRYAKLHAIVRTWHLNPWLPSDHQWPDVHWRFEGWAPSRRATENRTLPVAQSTMGPLLEWAIAFVCDFSDDILGAHIHYTSRMTGLQRGPGTAAKCRAILQGFVNDGIALPKDPAFAHTKRDADVAWTVISYRFGIASEAMAATYYRRMRDQPFTFTTDTQMAALDYVLSGRFFGRPWLPYISVFDVAIDAGRGRDRPGPLLGHLRTACLIVIAYLTGARVEEVLGLQSGAAPDPIATPGGAELHLIRGRVWKGVTRTSDGKPGDPKEVVWATIAPATRAVAILEQINSLLGTDTPLLFNGASGKIHPSTATDWITEFIAYVNDRLVPFTASPDALEVPADPAGLVTLRRFRRTLAWFIKNRPGGTITGAIQYQHAEERMMSGYGGTKEAGMSDLLMAEDWDHRRHTIENVARILATGGGVAGPAAGRAVAAAGNLPRHLTPSDERRLRKDASLVIYDNPDSLALCVWDESKALCVKRKHLGGMTEPRLLSCVDGCPNCARTDDQLAALDVLAQDLRAHASISPRPLEMSLLAEAKRCEDEASRFRSLRQTKDLADRAGGRRDR